MISFMPTQRYSPEQIQSFIQDAKRDGFVVLRDHLSREKLQGCHRQLKIPHFGAFEYSPV